MSNTSQKRCIFWDVSNTSPKRHLFCNVFKACQIHLKKDVFQLTLRSLRRLKHTQKRCLFSDVSDMSQNYMYLWLFKNITQKWLRTDKIDVWALKTFKKWNVVFWDQYIAINQSVMWPRVCMLFISAVWFTNHLAVLARQKSSNLRRRCIIYCF